MKAPKEVILDLLPLYASGEASPATRVWIEQYLAEDPALAERVRREQQESFRDGSPPLALPPELELRALHRTRRMLAILRWLFGLGMAFSAIGLALEVSLHPLRLRLLLLDYPAALVPCFAAGVICWTAYFRLRSRLRAI